jgi:predicted nucleic acid-binding protein
MSASHVFVDTNVLVYAYDESAGDKHTVARDLMEQLWASRTGCLSIQVLQEFFVTVTRKVPKPLDLTTASQAISDLSSWRVHCPEPDDVLAAIDVHATNGISFWDAMIVRSAAELGCDVLYSEDLNPGQRYGTVSALNPFQ